MIKKTSAKKRRIRLPSPKAGYKELADFFDRHSGVDLLEQGIMEPDPDTSDLQEMLLAYQKERNTHQFNIRIPATTKRMIERLARRKTVEVSTLVRMWVIEGMRREAQQP